MSQYVLTFFLLLIVLLRFCDVTSDVLNLHWLSIICCLLFVRFWRFCVRFVSGLWGELGQPTSCELRTSQQVAHLPFEQNWQHLASEPQLFFLEVGTNNYDLDRDLLGDLLQEWKDWFLVSFEPLLDKYADLLSDKSSEFSALGLQHPRALALPFAVDNCAGPAATFHVSPVDICSSLLPFKERFTEENQKIRAEGKGHDYANWIAEECAVLREKRTVPCVTLEQVLSEWLVNRTVARLKVDAQGLDHIVVQSAGAAVTQVRYALLEITNPGATPQYEGQLPCPKVMSSMRSLGFVLADDRLSMSSVCNASAFGNHLSQWKNLHRQNQQDDLSFIRRELKPLWRGFHSDYFFCRFFAAAGACGAPVCFSDHLQAQVNRTGGCEGDIVDKITFTSKAVGMIHLMYSPKCENEISVKVDTSVQIQIHQGYTWHARLCPVLSKPLTRVSFSTNKNESLTLAKKVQHVFLQVGHQSEQMSVAIVLPGIMTLEERKKKMVLRQILYLSEIEKISRILLPDSCTNLARSSLVPLDFYEAMRDHSNACLCRRINA